jgi:cell division septum initiation protein DivIVA
MNERENSDLSENVKSLEQEIDSLKSKVNSKEVPKLNCKFETQQELTDFTQLISEASENNAGTLSIIANCVSQHAQKLMIEQHFANAGKSQSTASQPMYPQMGAMLQQPMFMQPQ